MMLNKARVRLDGVQGSDAGQRLVRPPRVGEGVLLAEALSRLPEDYREVIVLRNLEGLSHEDVAARMGRAVGAVRMLWMRALARLRREFGTNEGHV